MIPGVYDDLSNAAYHAETDWLGSSQLKRHLPELFAGEPKNRTAFDFGSAFHSIVLGGPSEPLAIQSFPTWQSAAAKKAQNDAYQFGHIPVLTKDIDQIHAMNDALKAHPEAAGLIYSEPGQSELSVFAHVGDIPCKARFDRLVGSTVVDVKTTSSKPSRHELARAVVTFGYDLSAHHYLLVAAAAGIVVDSFVHVWVGKEHPHYVTVTTLDDEFLERGAALRETAIDRLLNPSMVAPYEGATGRLELPMPRWARL